MSDDLDAIWKALADRTRRQILDVLRRGPRTTTQIVERFPDLSRFGVMKHIDVLREAGLVTTRQQGRRRINALNVAPIRAIYDRWVNKFEDFWAAKLAAAKKSAEGRSGNRER